MVRKVLLGALTMLALFATPAAAQYNPIIVTPPEVLTDGELTVSGQSCAPFVEVVITLIEGDVTGQDPATVPDGVRVATTMTDENGFFTVTFKLPGTTTVGTYTVKATCGDVVEMETVDVVAPAPVPPGQPSGNLPKTGSDFNDIGLIGAGLLAVGGLVLLGTRRRRSGNLSAA